MKYNFDYEINESGTIILKGLPFKNRYVEIPHESQFRHLYSYNLINIDLSYAINYLDLCSKASDDIERQGLFRMAVIQYAKCYSPSKNGGRSPLDASKVYQHLPDDPIGCHNKFISMRNKYFAHDEIDFKSSKLGAVLNIENRTVAGIAFPAMQAKFDYDATVHILRKLCQTTIEWVQLKLDNEINRITQYITQKSFDELSAYNDLSIGAKV